MAPSDYHERLWESLPVGHEPLELRLRLAFLLERAPTAAEVGQAVRVLDVGCGEGRFVAELARAGMAVVGVDVAEEPLRRARALHPELDLDLRVIPLDGSWPLPDAGFDVVWAGETIEHVADTAGWLSEVRRVLRPRGALLLSTPAHGRLAMLAIALSARRFEAHFDPRGEDLRFYSARTLERLLGEFGFEHIEVRRAGGAPLMRRVLLASARRSRF
jgi:2-polyprenyl-3-methyl-5-hydroxy-6-metoxy-1,4-benzoquinol methylase